MMKDLGLPQLLWVYWRASLDHAKHRIEVVCCLPRPNNKECENESWNRWTPIDKLIKYDTEQWKHTHKTVKNLLLQRLRSPTESILCPQTANTTPFLITQPTIKYILLLHSCQQSFSMHNCHHAVSNSELLIQNQLFSITYIPNN